MDTDKSNPDERPKSPTNFKELAAVEQEMAAYLKKLGEEKARLKGVIREERQKQEALKRRSKELESKVAVSKTMISEIAMDKLIEEIKQLKTLVTERTNIDELMVSKLMKDSLNIVKKLQERRNNQKIHTMTTMELRKLTEEQMVKRNAKMKKLDDTNSEICRVTKLMSLAERATKELTDTIKNLSHVEISLRTMAKNKSLGIGSIGSF